MNAAGLFRKLAAKQEMAGCQVLRADILNPANGSAPQVRRDMGRHTQFIPGGPPSVALFLQPTGVAFHHRSQDRQGQISTGILRKDLGKHQKPPRNGIECRRPRQHRL